jgi:sigma-E factor negative regulatory protein RseA
MVMNEKISRLMDGELDDAADFEQCVGSLRTEDAYATWVCYHVIGDHLRGGRGVAQGFAARFSQKLAAEPTVLAPAAGRSARAPQTATFAWAVAATLAAVTVVGWTAFSMVDVPQTAVATAREAATVRAAEVRPSGEVPADYLLAHQEYSPGMAFQGLGPALRAVSTTTGVESAK